MGLGAAGVVQTLTATPTIWCPDFSVTTNILQAVTVPGIESSYKRVAQQVSVKHSLIAELLLLSMGGDDALKQKGSGKFGRRSCPLERKWV